MGWEVREKTQCMNIKWTQQEYDWRGRGYKEYSERENQCNDARGCYFRDSERCLYA
jgi:hypothetical protein